MVKQNGVVSHVVNVTNAAEPYSDSFSGKRGSDCLPKARAEGIQGAAGSSRKIHSREGLGLRVTVSLAPDAATDRPSSLGAAASKVSTDGHAGAKWLGEREWGGCGAAGRCAEAGGRAEASEILCQHVGQRFCEGEQSWSRRLGKRTYLLTGF